MCFETNGNASTRPTGAFLSSVVDFSCTAPAMGAAFFHRETQEILFTPLGGTRGSYSSGANSINRGGFQNIRDFNGRRSHSEKTFQTPAQAVQNSAVHI